MDDMISRQVAITAIQKAYADTVGGTDRCAVWKNVGLTNALNIMQDLPSVQTEKMQLSKEDATKGTTFDCISREDAIDVLAYFDEKDPLGHTPQQIIMALPSVQPDMSGNMSGTHKSLDCISRQAAIDSVCENCEYFKNEKLIQTIKDLPSAQPESRREWYMKGYRDAQAVSCADLCVDCPLFDHEKHECPRFNRVIPRTVEEVKPSWIPVTERLPEERDWYLGIFKEPDTGWINPLPFICDYLLGKKTKATTKEGWILRGFTDREEYIDYYFNLECVAWMPLPEPYAERRTDG